MEDRGGRIEVLLPYATLEPIRDLLLQGFMGEKFGRDNIWESHLASEIHKTSVSLEVVLDEFTLPLQRVMSLKVGDTVMLNNGPDDPVLLRCGGIPLVTGSVGRTGSNIAVRVAGGIPKRGGMNWSEDTPTQTMAEAG